MVVEDSRSVCGGGAEGMIWKVGVVADEVGVREAVVEWELVVVVVVGINVVVVVGRGGGRVVGVRGGMFVDSVDSVDSGQGKQRFVGVGVSVGEGEGRWRRNWRHEGGEAGRA